MDGVFLIVIQGFSAALKRALDLILCMRQAVNWKRQSSSSSSWDGVSGEENLGLSICFVVALPQICIFAWQRACSCGSDWLPTILSIVSTIQVFLVLCPKYCNHSQSILSMKLSFHCYSLLCGLSSGGLSTHSKRMFVLTAALTIVVSEVRTKEWFIIEDFGWVHSATRGLQMTLSEDLVLTSRDARSMY